MKAKEIYEYLLNRAVRRWDETCDGLIYGDENKEVKKVGACFKLSAQVLHQAIAAGVDMIITHEPTFSRGDRMEEITLPMDQRKLRDLQESGIVVYRFHDQCHDTVPDYIHTGFIRSVGLQFSRQYPVERLGICRYDLEQDMTVNELAALIKEKLGLEGLRIVGNRNAKVHTVCLGLGGVGVVPLQCLYDPGCDVFVTGESSEVLACEYVRDAAFYGEDKALLLLGHCSAEWAGMRYLAEVLNEKLIPTCYLHCGEVFSFA